MREQSRAPEGIVEDDDEVISSPLAAISAIAKHGYLTRLETPADTWYEIGEYLLAQDEYGQRITTKAALDLIKQGLVRQVASGHPPGDATTRAISFVIAAPLQ